ncbi:MAG: MATE family efflux transporter, partial [Oscillospiraceae bacterium]
MVSDMTVGKPSKVILIFALPMILGNLFQQLYNVVDSIVVGNFVGAAALAAVGASFPITFLSIAVAVGGSMGCSVVISQMFGAKLFSEMKTAIFTSLITIFAMAVAVTAIGLVFGKSILLLLGTPADILFDSLAYLHIYFLSIIFLFGYNILTAIFNALGNSKTPLYFLIFSSGLNIVLDLLFVIKFNMGVAGVAWATLISQGVSSVMLLTVLIRRLESIETDEPYSFFDKNILGKMAKIALPSIIQQSAVSVGMLMVQKLVNGYGTTVVAGYTAAT